MKAIKNLYKHWKKHGWKKTKKELYRNYVMLETPQQLLKKEIMGYLGGILGFLIIIVFFITTKRYLYIVSTGFMLLIFYAQLKGKLKHLQQLKDMEEEFGK